MSVERGAPGLLGFASRSAAILQPVAVPEKVAIP